MENTLNQIYQNAKYLCFSLAVTDLEGQKKFYLKYGMLPAQVIRDTKTRLLWVGPTPESAPAMYGGHNVNL